MIETERLLLRPPEAEDAEAIARQIADPDVMRYIGRGETGDLEDAVESVARMRRDWDDDGFGRFVVVRRDTAEAIGCVGLLVWDPLTWRNGTRREFGDEAEVELGLGRSSARRGARASRPRQRPRPETGP